MKRMEMAMDWPLSERTVVERLRVEPKPSPRQSIYQRLRPHVSDVLHEMTAIGRRLYWFLCGAVRLRRAISVSCLGLFALSVAAGDWSSVKPLAVLPVGLAGLLIGIRGGILTALIGIPAIAFGVALWNGEGPVWGLIDMAYLLALTACGSGAGRLRAVSERLSQARSDAQKIEAGARIREMKLRALINRFSINEERARQSLVARLGKDLDHVQAQVADTLSCLALQTSKFPTAFNETQTAIGEAFHSVREQTYHISPPVLHSVGLDAALDWLAMSVQQSTAVQVRYAGDQQRTGMGTELSILMFQVTRELLNNAILHAKARVINVTLNYNRQQVIVTVTDDGVGFDVAELGGRPYEKDGLGLFGVQERISGIGGAVEILSRPSAGTCVIIRAPLVR